MIKGRSVFKFATEAVESANKQLSSAKSPPMSWNRAVMGAEGLVNHKGSVINPGALLGDDLQLITDNIRRLLGSGHPVLETISAYYFSKRGKHIRPLIVLLMAQAAHNPLAKPTPSMIDFFYWHLVNVDAAISSVSTTVFTANSYSDTSPILNTQRRLAEIVEMVHTASLLHDDVIDDSPTRRSQPSANAKHGNKMAILAGDFLLARASVALARLHCFESVELIAEVIANLVEGEFMQLRSSADEEKRRGTQALDYYLTKTYMKTASLIAKSCRASVVLGNGTEHMANAAYNYGKNIGIAFQVYLNYYF